MGLAGLQFDEFDSNSPQKMLSPVLRVSLLLGICIHLAGFLVFRVSSDPLPSREAVEPFVQFVSPETLASGAELDEQAALFDSAPLFIAGQWNAAHNLSIPRDDRSLQRFPAYQPEMNVASELIPEGTSLGPNYAVREPFDLLASRFWDLFRGIELSESNPVQLDAVGVFAEVRSLTGQVIQSRRVDVDLSTSQAIQPVRFFVRLEAGGRLLGTPTLSVSSGFSEFDEVAYDWLVDSGFAASLDAGYFEVIVYP